MDETGVRRWRDSAVIEAVKWDELATVAVVTTSSGPALDDVFWLLGGPGGTGVAVPSEQAPDGLIQRLQALPGFDNEALIRALTCTEDRVFPCWPTAKS